LESSPKFKTSHETILTIALFSGYFSFTRNNAIWKYYSWVDTLAPWAMIAFMLIMLSIGIKKFGWELQPLNKVDLNNGAAGLMEKDETAHRNWWGKIYEWVVERVLLL
jgi:hypothetical protein